MWFSSPSHFSSFFTIVFTFESEGLVTSRFHRPENSAESLPTMNINSLSNGLSWMAPVPHFFVCFLLLFFLFSLCEEVFLHSAFHELGLVFECTHRSCFLFLRFPATTGPFVGWSPCCLRCSELSLYSQPLLREAQWSLREYNWVSWPVLSSPCGQKSELSDAHALCNNRETPKGVPSSKNNRQLATCRPFRDSCMRTRPNSYRHSSYRLGSKTRFYAYGPRSLCYLLFIICFLPSGFLYVFAFAFVFLILHHGFYCC